MNLDGHIDFKWCAYDWHHVPREDMVTMRLGNKIIHICSSCRDRKRQELAKERKRIVDLSSTSLRKE